MRKLSDAQMRMLASAPEDWQLEPLHGDSRPRDPLLRHGLIERRSLDVTPPSWGDGPVRMTRTEWRITEAGKSILTAPPSQQA
jgi:hypothetical protein